MLALRFLKNRMGGRGQATPIRPSPCVTCITNNFRELAHSPCHELHSAAEQNKGTTDMKTSRAAIFAFAAVVGIGSLIGSGQQAAAEMDLSFLNHMNPQYTGCVNNTRAQLLPQYRDDRAIADAIINRCASLYPPFGK